MIRINYTGYAFNPPTTPLSGTEYTNLRSVSDSVFKAELKAMRKEAGREGLQKFWGECKGLFVFTLVCLGLMWGLELLFGESKVAEYVFVSIGIIWLLGGFGMLVSSLSSLNSSSHFVVKLIKFHKRQRKLVLKSADYASYRVARMVEIEKEMRQR